LVAAATVAGVAAAAVTGVEPAFANPDLTLGSVSNTASAPTGVAVIGSNIGYGIGVTDNGLSSLPGNATNSAVLGHCRATAGNAFSKAVTGYASGPGIGVLGFTDDANGIAVYALAQSAGTALYCASTAGVAASFDGDQAAISIATSKAPPQSSSLSHVGGHVIGDSNKDVWLCVANGTPGTFRKLGGPATAGQLHLLPSTVRVYDSRVGFAPLDVQKGQLDASSERAIDMTKASSGVPAGATAVVVNLTVTNTDAAGWLALFKNGIAWPGNSSINWDHPSQTIANLAVVALDATAKIKARCVGATDFVIDVIGYYE
jgi:hypothetical protein